MFRWNQFEKFLYKRRKPFKSKEAIYYDVQEKEDRKILDEFTTRVRERFSDARVWAFGSRAKRGGDMGVRF